MTEKLTVFYDGKCSLCRWEIAFYKKRVNTNTVDWIDITNEEFNVDIYNLDYRNLLMHLHVEKSGNISKGVDAFILLWQHVPSWTFMAKLISFWPVKVVAKLAYQLFAICRFYAYSHCRIA